MRNQLAAYMLKTGFAVLPSNLSEFFIFIKREYSFVNVIQVMEIPKDSNFTREAFVSVRDTAKQLLEEKGLKDMHVLSLLLCEDYVLASDACADDRFSWVVDTTNHRLYIDETKAEDYYGLRKSLETFLETPDAFGSIEVGEDGFVRISGVEQEAEGEAPTETKVVEKYHVPPMVVFLMGLNVLVFIICTFMGNQLYLFGELSPTEVFLHGEWYRLMTSLFLHVDISHIFSNLLMFYLLGELLEREVGKAGLLFLYLGSGVAGGLCSLACSYRTGNTVSSVGASGAIFGIIGALLWLVIIRRGKVAYLTTGKILLLIAFIMYIGFISAGVDNAAHVGGLLSGFILAIPTCGLVGLWKKRKCMREEKKHED